MKPGPLLSLATVALVAAVALAPAPADAGRWDPRSSVSSPRGDPSRRPATVHRDPDRPRTPSYMKPAGQRPGSTRPPCAWVTVSRTFSHEDPKTGRKVFRVKQKNSCTGQVREITSY